MNLLLVFLLLSELFLYQIMLWMIVHHLNLLIHLVSVVTDRQAGELKVLSAHHQSGGVL